MSRWSLQIRSLLNDLPGLPTGDERIAGWLAEVERPLSQRIAENFTAQDLAALPHRFPPCLAELLLSDVAAAIDRILSYRYSLQELERDYVMTLLMLRTEWKRRSLEHDISDAVLQGSAALIGAFLNPPVVGDGELNDTLRMALPPFGNALNVARAKREELKDAIKQTEMQAWEARLAQLDQDGGSLNLRQRTDRLITRMYLEMREAYKKATAATAGLRVVYGLSDAQFNEYSGNRIGIQPPTLDSVTFLDDFVIWATTALSLVEQRTSNEQSEIMIIPLATAFGDIPALTTPAVFASTIAQGASGRFDFNLIEDQHFKNRARVRLRSVAVSFGTPLVWNSDNWSRVNSGNLTATVFLPDQDDGHGGSYRRPPANINMRVFPEISAVTGLGLYNANPIGSWTILLGDHVLDHTATFGRWDLLNNLFLHLELVTEPDLNLGDWL